MKTHLIRSLALLVTGLLAGGQLRATNLTSNVSQGPGTDWTAAIWQTNGTGTAVAAVPGNTYEAVGGALIRSTTTSGAPGATIAFLGNSLELDGVGTGLQNSSNGDLRTKGPSPYAYYNCGPVGGLILNGGFWGMGDDELSVMQCPVTVLTNSGIYAGQDAVNGNNSTSGTQGGFRAGIFTSTLSGSGNLTFGNALMAGNLGTTGGGTVAQQIANYGTNANFAFDGNGSNYTGSITVTAGWLQAGSANAFGSANITIIGAGTNTGFQSAANVLIDSIHQPAQFDATVAFSDSGTLTIAPTNSTLLLDNHMTFGAVIIDNVTLPTGVNYHAADINNLTGETNVVDVTGTNILTVGQVLAAPVIVTQPESAAVFANGVAQFTVSAQGDLGETLTYAWQKNGAPLAVNPPHIVSVVNPTLYVNNISGPDVAGYSVVVTGTASHLSTTSSVAPLSIAVPNGYQTRVLVADPVAFYSFSDTNNPALGGALCFDSVGGFNGIYGTNVQNGFDGVAGPVPADGFPYFPATNTAGLFTYNSRGSAVALPALNLNTNAVTISAWVYPTQPESNGRGIVFSRAGGTIAGLNYNTVLVNGDYQLGYWWGSTNTDNFQSGLFVPQNQWSLVALSVNANGASLYVINTNGIQTATHVYPEVIESFGATTLIGEDAGDGGNGSRAFAGSIDEVAVFNQTLTADQLLAQYGGASGVSNFPPSIVKQPLPAATYAGGLAAFTITTTGDPSYQWYRGSVALTNGLTAFGSTIFGATNYNINPASLIISNVTASDAGSYTVVLSNAVGSVTSTPAPLSLVTLSDPYAVAVVAAHPAYYYQFDETSDPSQGGVAAIDLVGGNDGLYGINVQNGFDGVAGPRPSDGFPNFSTTNAAALFPAYTANGTITTPAWNLNTNTLTITAWVNPNSTIINSYGIVMCRNGTGTAFGGLNFSSVADFNGYHTLGYNWGDAAATTNWFSGLYVPEGQWSFVAVSITATNATLYLVNSSGLMTAVNNFNHASLAFGAPVTIGGDSLDGGADIGNLNFPGTIDNVAIFKNSLSQSQILALYGAASGVSNFPVTIASSPTNLTVIQGQTAQFSVQASGNPGPFYQWQVQTASGYTNLTDGGQFSGSQSPTLTITDADLPNAANYIVLVTNYLSGLVASTPAYLTVNPAPTPVNHTLAYGGSPIVQPQNTNWDSPNQWTPDGASATASVAVSPFDTFEVQAGELLRSPTTTASFPGTLLTIDGNGVFTNGGSPAIGELRFKASPMTMPKLVMNGGQIDVSVGAHGAVVLNGLIDIVSNTPFYDDSANDQGYTINATLTGAGGIELDDLGYALTNGVAMNIAGSANSYTGAWNVVQGTLLGTGANALGTNAITVGASGALETTYNLNDTNAILTLNGIMLLHQTDTFYAVTVGGHALPIGTNYFASLAANYAANFPANWAAQTGSSVTNGSGSIIALTGPAPTPALQSPVLVNGNLILTWVNGTLQSATNVIGPWVPVPGAVSPYTNSVLPTVPDLFFRVAQ